MSLPYNVRDIELLRGQRPQPATVLDSGVVDEVETDLESGDGCCDEEDEENQPFTDEDDTGEEDDNVNDD